MRPENRTTGLLYTSFNLFFLIILILFIVFGTTPSVNLGSAHRYYSWLGLGDQMAWQRANLSQVHAKQVITCCTITLAPLIWLVKVKRPTSRASPFHSNTTVSGSMCVKISALGDTGADLESLIIGQQHVWVCEESLSDSANLSQLWLFLLSKISAVSTEDWTKKLVNSKRS